MLQTVLSQLTLANFMAVLYLIILECVLSTDNALSLAVLVNGRLTDPDQKKKALRFGMIFAYIIRILVILAGTWLMAHEWVKVIAGLYLVYLASSELFFKKSLGEDAENEIGGFNIKGLSPFISTIISVEVLDFFFSIDSISTALTISSNAFVLITAGLIGVAAMRFVAGLFIKLIEKLPILEPTAMVLVGFAGLRILAEEVGINIPEIAFMLSMFVIISVAVCLNGWYIKRKTKKDMLER